MKSLVQRIFIGILIAAGLVPGFPALAQAQETLEMQGTAIIGNKELPKVLYIVPWKSPERFDIAIPPVTSILDQALTPIDRRVFNRKIKYHKILFTDLSK